MAPVQLTEAEKTHSAKRMFKCVSGILNGAYGADQCQKCSADVRMWSEHVDPTFANLCGALAAAVDQGYVPQQGRDVMKSLVFAAGELVHSSLGKALGFDSNVLDKDVHVENSAASTTDDEVPALEAKETTMALQKTAQQNEPCGCCCQPLESEPDTEMTEEEKADSAKRLFKCVSGILNGAFGIDKSRECMADLQVWCKHGDPTFATLCDALASAIEQKLIPDRGMAVLQGLAPQMWDRGLTSQSSLALTLNVALDKPDPTRAAQRIFAYVTATLRGTCLQPVHPEDISVWSSGDGVGDNFEAACDALAAVVEGGSMPSKPVLELCALTHAFPEYNLLDSRLERALVPHLCPQCKVNAPSDGPCKCNGSGLDRCANCSGSGKFKQPCRGCDGTGRGRTKRYCPVCDGTGQKVLGDCRECQGRGRVQCLHCCMRPEAGQPRLFCTACAKQCAAVAREQQERRQSQPKGFQKQEGPPQNGVSIEKCAAGDITRLRDLWTFRGGPGEVIAAWKVDNPLLTYKFKKRREVLKTVLGREADILEGFHGTTPANFLSIIDTGFDKGKRGAAVGQVHGSGEYFAKDPSVSLSYCRGGQYMLVCRLTLGVASTYSGASQAQDGDHVWVPTYGGSGCYVIAEPNQILPQFIVQFSSGAGSLPCPKLEHALTHGHSTKLPAEIVPVPSNQRPCQMSREAATVLWMGFLHAHFSDDSLREDVRKFLQTHAAQYMYGAKIQIVKGHYKKAHAILKTPIPRALVHKLNSAPFIEQGSRRTICVEDAHGSPGQKCPRYIAGNCRGQNLRHTYPCFCSHPPRATEQARFTLEPIDFNGAKGVEIRDKFMASAPFHTGHPTIVGIQAIKNETLSRCHEEYRKYLTTKHVDEPAEQELYHGTNNNISDILYKHGLQPPSDCAASDACPVSGGKGLCTTLCDNTCVHCTKKHEWKRCHMYGLGIYHADMAQKSHRYISQPKIGRNGRPTYRMIVCSVLGKSFQIEGHLKDGPCMHDVVNVRALDEEGLDEMIAPCAASRATRGVGASIAGLDGSVWGRVVAEEDHCWRLHSGRIAKMATEGSMWKWCATDECSADNREGSAEKSDLLFVKGLGDRCRAGYSVVNSEYIAFHPHQCLPKYEIEYEIN
jgi:hypothetical protein